MLTLLDLVRVKGASLDVRGEALPLELTGDRDNSMLSHTDAFGPLLSSPGGSRTYFDSNQFFAFSASS